MRQYYDDFEEFEYADSKTRSRMMREQRREASRHATRRKPWRRTADYLDRDDFDDFSEYHSYTRSFSGH